MKRKRRKREPDRYCPRCKTVLSPSYILTPHECYFPCPSCKIYVKEGEMERHKGTCDPAKAEKDRALMRESMNRLNEIVFGKRR